jgi:hypothetical protein
MNRRKPWIIAAILIGGVYLAGVSSHWLPTPDSGLYLHQAQGWIDHGEFLYNGQPCLRASPGYILFLAGIIELAGTDHPFLLHGISLLFCIGTLWVIAKQRWLWGTRFSTRWVVLGTALTYYFVHPHRFVLTDSMGAFLCVLTLHIARRARKRPWMMLTLLPMGYIVVMIRMPLLLLLAPMGVAAIFEPRVMHRRWWGRMFGSGMLALGCLVAWWNIKGLTPAVQSTPYSGWEWTDVSTMAAEFFPSVGILMSKFLMAQTTSIGGGILGAIVLIGLIRQVKHRLYFPLIFLATSMMLMAGLVGPWTLRFPRYWIVALPMILYAFLLGGAIVGGWLTHLLRMKAPCMRLPVFGVVLMMIGVGIQSPRIIKETVNIFRGHGQNADEFYAHYEEGEFYAVHKISSLAEKPLLGMWGGGMAASLKMHGGTVINLEQKTADGNWVSIDPHLHRPSPEWILLNRVKDTARVLQRNEYLERLKESYDIFEEWSCEDVTVLKRRLTHESPPQ